MSTKLKDNKYYIEVKLKDVKQSVIISQIRTFDAKRLHQFIGYISKKDFIEIKHNIKRLL